MSCFASCPSQVVGIITRHDLTHENLCLKWHDKRLAAKEQRKQQKHSMNINNVSVSYSRSDNDDVFA